MFLAQRRRRIHFLQSYRDGSGKVRQRRLYAVRCVADLHQWDRLKAELERLYPALEIDWDRLHRQAQELLRNLPRDPDEGAQTRLAELKRALQKLRGLLEEETDPKVLQEVAGDLAAVGRFGSAPTTTTESEEERLQSWCRRTRQSLPPRRTRFEPWEAGEYLEALEQLASFLERAERWPEAVVARRQRHHACPGPETALALGQSLQRAGHPALALELYRTLPWEAPRRHYHVASALLQAGREREALPCLVMALDREPEVGFASRRAGGPEIPPERRLAGDFWERFGATWTERARRFLLATLAEPLVAYWDRHTNGDVLKKRKVLPEPTLNRLFERIQTRLQHA